MIVKRDFPYGPEAKNRPLHIWLPDDYEQSGERYPVMYFLDGHNLFSDEDATYGKSWGFTPFLQGWPKDIIIVGIECGHGEGERLSEYLPWPALQHSFCKGISPTGDYTFEWIIKELKPVIDEQYRTYPVRSCTAIGGSSMGGLMALYGALHCNETFSKAACISSSVSVCMEPIRKELEQLPIDADTRVYLSWGTREAHGGVTDIWQEDTESASYRWNTEIAQRAESSGACTRVRCQVGGGHCEADWEKLVPEFMHFLWME